MNVTPGDVDLLVDCVLYAVKDNGVHWTHKSRLIRKRFEERGELEALEEFVEWFLDTDCENFT